MCQINSVPVMRKGDVECQCVLFFFFVASGKKDTSNKNYENT